MHTLVDFIRVSERSEIAGSYQVVGSVPTRLLGGWPFFRKRHECVETLAIEYRWWMFGGNGLRSCSLFNPLSCFPFSIKELIQSDPTSCPQNQKGNN